MGQPNRGAARAWVLGVAGGLFCLVGLSSPTQADNASGNGFFRLRNVNSGLCLVSRGGPEEQPALQVDCEEDYQDQYWFYSACAESPCTDLNAPTQIINAATGRCLIARGVPLNTDEDAVVTGGCDESFEDQLWEVQLLNARSFVLLNVYTGKRLLVRGYAPETPVITTWIDRDYADQHWTEEDRQE